MAEYNGVEVLVKNVIDIMDIDMVVSLDEDISISSIFD